MPRTTTILRIESSRNVWKSVRWLTVLLVTPVSGSFGCGVDLDQRLTGLEALNFVEGGREAAQGPGGEEAVAGGKHEVAASGGGGGCCELQMLIVAAEQLQAEKVVAGDETLDLVED